MGRAFEVRKASILKTGQQKAKIYSVYAKEIYQAAKNGGTDPVANDDLKRILERAKKDQVPSDLIKRAIDKVKSGANENYEVFKYEVMGPCNSSLIVECLTDNSNRSLSDIRTVLNKTNAKLVNQGTFGYLFNTFSKVVVNNVSVDDVMDVCILNDIDVLDVYILSSSIVVTGSVKDLNSIKVALLTLEGASINSVEIVTEPIEKLVLDDECMNEFSKIINMLEEVDDVKNIFHNVCDK